MQFLIILEFDHADIYPIFPLFNNNSQYFLRTIPSNGLIIKPRDDAALNEVITQAQYTPLEDLALNGRATWRAELLDDMGQAFRVWHLDKLVAEINWTLIGAFNVENGLAAMAASARAGVNPRVAAAALEQF